MADAGFEDIDVVWEHDGKVMKRWSVEINPDAPVQDLLPELMEGLKIHGDPSSAVIENVGTTRKPVYKITTKARRNMGRFSEQ